MHTIAMRITGCVALMVMGGCGGGGGGDDDAPPPAEPVVIDQSNAMEVTASVLGPVTLIRELGTGGGILPVALNDSAVSTISGAVYGKLRELIKPARYFQAVAAGGQGVQFAALEFGPFTEDCSVSGTLTLSPSFADGSLQYLNVGDTVAAEFDRCDEGDGMVLDGGLRIEVLTRVAFDFQPPYTFGSEFTFSNLSITEGGETAAVSGGLMVQEATRDGVVFETELSGEQLSVAVNGDTELLRYFEMLGRYDDSDGSYSLEVRCPGERCARLESSGLNGFVDFGSIEPFAGAGDDAPFSGILSIVGGVAAGGLGPSALAAEALNANCVELRLDENGDSAIDWTQRTTWASLLAGVTDPC